MSNTSTGDMAVKPLALLVNAAKLIRIVQPTIPKKKKKKKAQFFAAMESRGKEENLKGGGRKSAFFLNFVLKPAAILDFQNNK